MKSHKWKSQRKNLKFPLYIHNRQFVLPGVIIFAHVWWCPIGGFPTTGITSEGVLTKKTTEFVILRTLDGVDSIPPLTGGPSHYSTVRASEHALLQVQTCQ